MTVERPASRGGELVAVRVLLSDSANVHAALLDALSSELAVPRSRISIERDAYGKPYVAAPETEIRFSISHTHEHAVLAFTRGVEVGADVELLRSDVAHWALWNHVLVADEVALLPSLRAARTRALLRIWVAKEAILKAAGTGLDMDPGRIQLDAHGRIVAAPPELGEPASWCVAWLDLEATVGAVACRAPGVSVSVDPIPYVAVHS